MIGYSNIFHNQVEEYKNKIKILLSERGNKDTAWCDEGHYKILYCLIN